MQRDLLSHLPVVRAVAQCGGFAPAAARLGMSPSAVSHAIKTVEDGLGLPLFARTTRSVALTEAGANFLASIAPALAMIEDAAERVRAAKGTVNGVLRLNVPRLAQQMAVAPVVAEMVAHYPELTIDITIDDRLVDIVGQGFDAGIRLGEMIAEDMIAVRLTPPFKAILVAAPAYLERNGEPRTIVDLAHHNCIGFRLATTGGVYAWELKGADGAEVSVRVGGSVRLSDPDCAMDLARAAVGIAYIFEPLVREDLQQGRLCRLIPEASVEQPGLFLYFPRGAAATPKLRAFVDIAKDLLKSDGGRPQARIRSAPASKA
jgi:DNA-binding transcriptional LysR family regulator